MVDAHEQAATAATTQAQPNDPTMQAQPNDPTMQAQPNDPTTQAQSSEQEMRAAYEAELNRISSSEMILQTAVSLLNIGGRRLGLAPPHPLGAHQLRLATNVTWSRCAMRSTVPAR